MADCFLVSTSLCLHRPRKPRDKYGINKKSEGIKNFHTQTFLRKVLTRQGNTTFCNIAHIHKRRRPLKSILLAQLRQNN